MIFGYARISTKKQSMERQIRNLKEYNKDIVIIQEIYTGTKTEERRVYQNLKRKLKIGDTLVFDSISRMSRNAEEGIKEYFELYQKGIKLVFLKERYIDTEVYNNQLSTNKNLVVEDKDLNETILKGVRDYLILIAKNQIRIAFEQSEKEVMDLRIRTKEALRVKQQFEGVILGRKQGTKIETKKSKEMKENIKKLSKDFEGNLKDKEVIEILKIAKNSYYKYKRELREL